MSNILPPELVNLIGEFSVTKIEQNVQTAKIQNIKYHCQCCNNLKKRNEIEMANQFIQVQRCLNFDDCPATPQQIREARNFNMESRYTNTGYYKYYPHGQNWRVTRTKNQLMNELRGSTELRE